MRLNKKAVVVFLGIVIILSCIIATTGRSYAMEKTENIKTLCKNFNVSVSLPENKTYVIDRIGRAANLTQEDLDNANKIDKRMNYVFGSDRRLEEYRKSYAKLLQNPSEDQLLKNHRPEGR